jgi:hypothetical protein
VSEATLLDKGGIKMTKTALEAKGQVFETETLSARDQRLAAA